MLREMEKAGAEDVKDFVRKSVASRLDLLIKKTAYNIENASFRFIWKLY